MKGFVVWATSSAIAMGGVGFFLVAFVDASFLALPEAGDILIVVAAAKAPGRLVYYASMLAAGSTIGSLMLFALGRTGGRALLEKKFSGRRVERGYRLVQRYGFPTLFVASLLPPPTPFKLFALLAGACGMGVFSFAASVALGRAVRYLGGGLLALRYGDRALDVIRGNGAVFGLLFAATALTSGLAYFVWRRLRTRPELHSVLEQR
jgi:membrane protein YqaA with SNARE-associated domain